jgi:hypothetical protein
MLNVVLPDPNVILNVELAGERLVEQIPPYAWLRSSNRKV